MVWPVIQDGVEVVTNSSLKTFRRCPKQFEYKFVQRLRPKRDGKDSWRGKWIHALLEAHYRGLDWREEHAKWRARFRELWDDDQEYFGTTLPEDIERLVRGYIWHYAADNWKVLQVEFTHDVELPDGSIYRMRADMLVEDPVFGIMLVDHKSHKSLPDLAFRIADTQSALYLWALQKAGIEVQAFCWNYLRYKAPTIPKLTSTGRIENRANIDTDYPTYFNALKAYQQDGVRIGPDHRQRLARLKSYRFAPGEPQLSTFFRRDNLEKHPDMLNRVARENYRTKKRAEVYEFGTDTERAADRSCRWCDFRELCTAELMTGDGSYLRRHHFRVADPMAYYDEEKERVASDG